MRMRAAAAFLPAPHLPALCCADPHTTPPPSRNHQPTRRYNLTDAEKRTLRHAYALRHYERDGGRPGDVDPADIKAIKARHEPLEADRKAYQEAKVGRACGLGACMPAKGLGGWVGTGWAAPAWVGCAPCTVHRMHCLGRMCGRPACQAGAWGCSLHD